MPRSSDQTRPAILQAAYKLFRRRGFFRVGMDEIAVAAGVTKKTLYYHFDSKDALLTAVLASQHERAFAEFQT
ncbi:MAG: helix-turn-helix transcriptional regulator, partial [Mesorhizobium sp.]